MTESLLQSLSTLALSPESASHPSPSADKPWSALLPDGVHATKTLLFKPKASKTAQVKPVCVVALDSTDVGTANALAKQLGIKEMRAATDDVWKEWFGTEKEAGEYL